MLLWDQGFTKTPEDRIGALFWRMHRCARIIFSFSFHLGKMSAQECVDFLVNRVGFERENAAGEVRRSFESGYYGPLYQAAYMLGALQFRALHQDLVGSGKMSDRDFHDAILEDERDSGGDGAGQFDEAAAGCGVCVELEVLLTISRIEIIHNPHIRPRLRHGVHKLFPLRGHARARDVFRSRKDSARSAAPYGNRRHVAAAIGVNRASVEIGDRNGLRRSATEMSGSLEFAPCSGTFPTTRIAAAKRRG